MKNDFSRLFYVFRVLTRKQTKVNKGEIDSLFLNIYVVLMDTKDFILVFIKNYRVRQFGVQVLDKPVVSRK